MQTEGSTSLSFHHADVVKSANTLSSDGSALSGLWVRVPPSAPCLEYRVRSTLVASTCRVRVPVKAPHALVVKWQTRKVESLVP